MEKEIWITVGIIAGLFAYACFLGRMLAGPDDYREWLDNDMQWERDDE